MSMSRAIISRREGSFHPPGPGAPAMIYPAMLPPGRCSPRLFPRGVSRRIRPRRQPQNPGVISERRYITSFQLFHPDSKTSSRYASESQAGCPLTCNAHTQNSLHSSERGKTSLTRLSRSAPAPALLMEAAGGSAGMQRHAPVQGKGAHVNRQQEPPGPVSPPA
ncbi:uncharacterized protein ACIBXB_002969 [Morphnus guianensis]